MIPHVADQSCGHPLSDQGAAVQRGYRPTLHPVAAPEARAHLMPHRISAVERQSPHPSAAVGNRGCLTPQLSGDPAEPSYPAQRRVFRCQCPRRRCCGSRVFPLRPHGRRDCCAAGHPSRAAISARSVRARFHPALRASRPPTCRDAGRRSWNRNGQHHHRPACPIRPVPSPSADRCQNGRPGRGRRRRCS
jgi:hypothetical protein